MIDLYPLRLLFFLLSLFSFFFSRKIYIISTFVFFWHVHLRLYKIRVISSKHPDLDMTPRCQQRLIRDSSLLSGNECSAPFHAQVVGFYIQQHRVIALTGYYLICRN